MEWQVIKLIAAIKELGTNQARYKGEIDTIEDFESIAHNQKFFHFIINDSKYEYRPSSIQKITFEEYIQQFCISQQSGETVQDVFQEIEDVLFGSNQCLMELMVTDPPVITSDMRYLLGQSDRY